MIPFFYAWAIGESIIIYRWVKAGAPPTPGALAAPAGLFIGLAIIAEAPKARPAAVAFAFAVDLAILLQVVGKAPGQFTGWPPPLINDPAQLLPGGSPSTGNTTTQAGTVNTTGASSLGTAAATGTDAGAAA
jgi:hypothetical protein